MKFVLLLVFVGLASANFRDTVLRSVTKDVVYDFAVGMDRVPSLKSVLGIRSSTELEEVEEEIKTGIAETLKEALDKLLEKIKDKVDHGHRVAKETLDKVNELKEKLKALHEDIGAKAKELLKNLGERFKNFLKGIGDKLSGGDVSKRGITDYVKDLISSIDLRAILMHIKEMLLEKLDEHVIQKYVHQFLGSESPVSQFLSELLRSKSSNLIQAVIDRLISESAAPIRAAPSLKEIIEKGKGLFRDVSDDVKERLDDFLNWLKKTLDAGAEKAKESADRLKELGREFLKNSRELTKEGIESALEIFVEYKDQLGHLYDEIVEEARKVLHKLKHE